MASYRQEDLDLANAKLKEMMENEEKMEKMEEGSEGAIHHKQEIDRIVGEMKEGDYGWLYATNEKEVKSALEVREKIGTQAVILFPDEEYDELSKLIPEGVTCGTPECPLGEFVDLEEEARKEEEEREEMLEKRKREKELDDYYSTLLPEKEDEEEEDYDESEQE